MVLKPTRSPLNARVSSHTAWLAKIDVAGQLSHDENVQASHHFRLQRRRIGEFGVKYCRAQVCKQIQCLRMPSKPLSGRN